MGNFGEKSINAFLRAAMRKKLGLGRINTTTGAIRREDYAFDNNFPLEHESADGLSRIETVRVDKFDKLMYGGAHVVQPCLRPITCVMPVNGDIVTKVFHVFNYPARVKAIYEIHATAGNDAAAVTLNVTKDTSTDAPGAGITVQSGTFNLKGTANTLQTATLASNPNTLECAAGDRLSVVLTGTATTAAAVNITVWVQYYKLVQEFSVYVAAGNADQGFFIANRPYTVLAASFVAKTAEVTTTTQKIQLTQDTSTNATGAGTDLLTNNTNAGFSAVAAANTVQNGTWATNPTLAAGDRLSIDYSGTSTELAGICVTVAIAAQPERIEVPFFDIDTDVAEVVQLIADRDYEFIEARQIHETAAGGTSTAQIETSTSTTAPGSGTTVMASTANLNATAATVQILAPTAVLSDRIIPALARIALDYNHTEQSLTGNVTTASLRAI